LKIKNRYDTDISTRCPQFRKTCQIKNIRWWYLPYSSLVCNFWA